MIPSSRRVRVGGFSLPCTVVAKAMRARKQAQKAVDEEVMTAALQLLAPGSGVGLFEGLRGLSERIEKRV